MLLETNKAKVNNDDFYTNYVNQVFISTYQQFIYKLQT